MDFNDLAPDPHDPATQATPVSWQKTPSPLPRVVLVCCLPTILLAVASVVALLLFPNRLMLRTLLGLGRLGCYGNSPQMVLNRRIPPTQSNRHLMQNQPSTFRFTLRALFICTAFVGLGLLALMHPFHWVPSAIILAVAFLFAYSIVAVLASTDQRRLFWAAFAATAAAILLMSESIFSQLLPHDWMTSIFLHLHPTDKMGVQNRDADMAFVQTVNRLLTITISTVAAYIIPWLVQRGQKPSGD